MSAEATQERSLLYSWQGGAGRGRAWQGRAKFLTLLPPVGQSASGRDETWVFFLPAITVHQFILSVPRHYEPTFGKRYSKVLLHWIASNIFFNKVYISVIKEKNSSFFWFDLGSYHQLGCGQLLFILNSIKAYSTVNTFKLNCPNRDVIVLL